MSALMRGNFSAKVIHFIRNKKFHPIDRPFVLASGIEGLENKRFSHG